MLNLLGIIGLFVLSAVLLVLLWKFLRYNGLLIFLVYACMIANYQALNVTEIFGLSVAPSLGTYTLICVALYMIYNHNHKEKIWKSITTITCVLAVVVVSQILVGLLWGQPLTTVLSSWRVYLGTIVCVVVSSCLVVAFSNVFAKFIKNDYLKFFLVLALVLLIDSIVFYVIAFAGTFGSVSAFFIAMLVNAAAKIIFAALSTFVYYLLLKTKTEKIEE